MTKTPSPRRSALSLSIILNLFLVAIIVGHMLMAPSQRLGGLPLAQALEHAEASLPPKDAAAFRRTIRDTAPSYVAAAGRLAEAREALVHQIAADPFNPAAVRQALLTWRVAWNGFFDSFSGPLVDALAAVSPEGRHKMVADHEAARSGLSAVTLGR